MAVGAAGAGVSTRPIDVLFAAYLLLAGAALLFPHGDAAVRWPLALVHVAGIIVLLALRSRVSDNRLARALRDWYPLLLMPLLYTELAVLNRFVWDGAYFDEWIIGWERALFGGMPAVEWAARVPSRIVSELLHASYLSYYLIIYVPPLVLYLRGRHEGFRETVFALMLTFFVHYLFFVYFPVQGPRYLYETPVAPEARGPVHALAHALLAAGSSQGAAFPSSHVAVAVAQCVCAWRFLRPLFAPLIVLSAGLALGAVYGGFHYGTDALAGAVLGLLLALIAPRLRRRLA